VCGIAGVVVRDGGPPDRHRLEVMVDAVAHRGPDGSGTFVEGRVGLGHRRLAIIDLSEAAAQPMRCPDTGRVIVYNGEVYNYVELRAELAGQGTRFRTTSDTEVILAAYDRWGPSCVQRFNGMWAFALYDPAADVLFCSRDRFGVKPFCYADTPHAFVFGSELRQILPWLDRRQASRPELLDFLGFSIDERGTRTFFAGVRRLAPGHNLHYRIGRGTFTVERYYRVPRQEHVAPASAREAGEAVGALLEDAVRLRLRSDVPVGTCLSGGLDSSSVAALASRLSAGPGRPFAAITAVPDSAAHDESAFARQVVEHARLDWHVVRADRAAFEAVLPDVVRAQEEPFQTPSACLQFLVMQAARRQGIPVLLDGQGGDETLLGYERYAVPVVRQLAATEGMASAWRQMRALSRHNDKLTLLTQAQLLAYFSLPALRWRRYRRQMGGAPWLPPLAAFRDRQPAPESIFELQRRQVEDESLPHLLRYEDRNSMWHGVEARLPFLDYRLVELALNLPAAFKIGDGWTKLALREAMRDRLPPAVVWRTRKMGFEAPADHWLGHAREAMLDTVARSALIAEACGTSSIAPTVRRAPLPVLWRFHVTALWEREFGVAGVTG